MSLSYSIKPKPKKKTYILLIKPEHSNEIILKAKINETTLNTIKNLIKTETINYPTCPSNAATC